MTVTVQLVHIIPSLSKDGRGSLATGFAFMFTAVKTSENGKTASWTSSEHLKFCGKRKGLTNNICQKNATASTGFCNIWCGYLCLYNPRLKSVWSIIKQQIWIPGDEVSLFKTREYIWSSIIRSRLLNWRSGSWFFFFNKSHFYYAQVQGQLALTGFPWCDFCVYLSDSNELILITGKMSYCPNWRTYFSIMHFHLLLGKQEEPKAIQEPMKN